MRKFLALLIAFLIFPAAVAAQDAPPQPDGDEDLAVYWDRDFDLILEEKQGDERVNRGRVEEFRILEEEIEAVSAEIADLQDRRAALDNSYSTEDLLQELLVLEVSSAAEARDVLDERILEARSRLGDLEIKFERMVRRKQRP